VSIFKKHLLLGASLGLLASPAVLAQDAPADSEASADVIVVTGTSIRGISAPASNTVAVDRTEMEVAAISTTTQLLARIPQTEDFNTLPAGSSAFGGVTDVPNLRGIGLGGTASLTLLNGRRMVGAGILQTIPEPSAIPPLALERVEVVVDGASAIYGSDAVAGVINLIPRRDFDGGESVVRYGVADAYTEINLGHVQGFSWDSGSALLAYDYNHHDNLSGADRDFVTTDFSGIGGTDERSTSCGDANIALGGFEIYPGYFYGEVTFAAPDFLPGTQNRCDTTDWTDIYGEETRHSVYGSLRQTLRPGLELYADAYYSQRETEVRQAQEAISFTMPFTNPYFFDPSGSGQLSTRVSYRFNDEFGDSVVDEAELWTSGVVGGLIFDFANDWQLDTYINLGWGNSRVFEPGINQIAAYTAAFGFTPDTALDPFGGNTNPAVLAAIGDYASVAEADQRMAIVNAKADGPLFEAPGGTALLAVGVQTHYEDIDATLETGPVGTPSYQSAGAGDRRINSLFSELYVPLVGSDNAVPGVRSLDLSLAARYDNYSDFGDTTNPKVALVWEVVDGFSVRSSWGTSFHAPSLADADAQTVDARVQVVPSLPSFLTPPGYGELDAIVIAGGNPDLKPEEATTTTFGVEFAPSSLPGLTASLTWYDIEFENGLAVPVDSTGRIYTIPGLSEYYVLFPTAAEVDAYVDGLPIDGALPDPVELILDGRRQNLQTQLQQGLDFSVQHFGPAFGGDLAVRLTGNYILDSDIQVAPGEGFVSTMDSRVQLRGIASATWFGDHVRLGAAVNYTGGADNETVTPVQGIDEYITMDLNAGYTFDENGPFGGVTVAINVDNVFDEDPPSYVGAYGYANGNPLGRLVAVSLRKTW